MRHRLTGNVCVLASLVVLVSCSKGSPSAPGGPNNPTVTSITVTSSGAQLFLGVTETFTATMQMSNGTVQPLSGGVWGTDAGAVATVVPASGAVTGVSSGEVSVFVDAQGVRGSKRITVRPNYAGIWGGVYTVNSCTQTGDFAVEDVCSIFPTGAMPPVAFNLTQTGATVAGRTALGSIVSNQFTTTMGTNGSLMFPATALVETITIAQTWQINITQASRLDGTLVQTWTEPTAIGQMVIQATLSGVGPSGDVDLVSSSQSRPRTLREIARAVTGGRR